MNNIVITKELIGLFMDRFFSAVYNTDYNELEALISAGFGINTPHYYHGRTALMEATRTGNYPLMEWLIEQKANPSQSSTDEQHQALHIAADRLDIHATKILLEAGVNPSGITLRSKTALHLLAQKDPEVIDIHSLLALADILLATKPELQILDSESMAPLHYCALQRNIALAHRLLEAGANPSVRHPTHGATPLHIVMLEKHFAFADLLYAYGADDTVRNALGKTPRELCVGKKKHYTPPEMPENINIQDLLIREQNKATASA